MSRARKGKVLARIKPEEGGAEDVQEAVLDLDIDDLDTRAGRHGWGYVEPADAAWELLEEAINPFLAEMKRHIEPGFEAAATATCAGIVMGLYRCRGKNSDQVLGWAVDFPAETAGHAVATLAGFMLFSVGSFFWHLMGFSALYQVECLTNRASSNLHQGGNSTTRRCTETCRYQPRP